MKFAKLAAASVAALAMGSGLLATTAASASEGVAAHFNQPDSQACHAVYEMNHQGYVSAKDFAELQVGVVRGTQPYKHDARVLVNQIRNHHNFHPSTRALTKACGRHH